ncbi:MAG: DUF4411 family protein [Thermodesulfobacteriota bacterium]|nr:DUF4411 family protein [Thermodesulfobacteriota bacterium]MEA3544385.1 DUF4411 family protein [Thermodesulfobacteriota bacterium]
MTYLLDANVFMQAKNLHYGFDFCPAFWDWLLEQNAADKVFSIEKVADEIYAGDDDLSVWAKELAGDFFLPPDANVVANFAEVSTWATGQNFEPAAVNTFLQVADYYLICYAKAHEAVVVTHEKPSNSTKKIKIPNVCAGLGIKFMTPFEMLRLERARFVLGSLVDTLLPL